MRIIFLNTAHGRLGKGLFDFVETNLQITDIFCFQEADEHVCVKMNKILSNFVSLRRYKDIYFLASYIKKGLLVKSEKQILDGDMSVGLAEIFRLSFGQKNLYISSIHGIARPGDKKDNPARIRQTRKIIESNSKVNGPKIIGGDFNLFPDTKSIKMLEEAGYINLIKEYKVKNTRNSHAWIQAKEMVKDGFLFYGKQPFADYVFVSPEIKVKSFEVPNLEISDHLPLILDFEI